MARPVSVLTHYEAYKVVDTHLVRVSCRAERSGSEGCPLTGAYVSSVATKSDCISSDFMAGEVRE